MITKITILNRLKKNRALLHQFGINQIGLFGSYQNGEATKQSDIDILIDFEFGKETFDNYMDICHFLEKMFKNNKVDVVTKKGLSPHIAPYILKEVEYA